MAPSEKKAGWFSFFKRTKTSTTPSKPSMGKPATLRTTPAAAATACAVVRTPVVASVGSDRGTVPLEPCHNNCGWTAFPGHSSCCRGCRGPDGPHSKDCEIKNQCVQPQCAFGCGRPAFGLFTTCCTKCRSAEGPHAKDCAHKGHWIKPADGEVPAKVDSNPRDIQAVEEDLRTQLTAWRDVGAMRSPEEVDDVVNGLAASAGMEPDAVRMLWLSTARQARPVGGPAMAYIELAQKHHGVDVEVVDLGQYSAEHSNSCMFLTCAVSIADRRLKGYADAELPGVLGECLEAAGSFDQTFSIDELVEEHSRTRMGTLGRMADALRHAACEVLLFDKEFYRPFFHPVRGGHISPSEADFDRWVKKMRGNEEGDELVILALARLCGIAVQPVQQSGYRVPLMDPTGAVGSDCITYWGNDDHHWVWLRTNEERPKEVDGKRLTYGCASVRASKAIGQSIAKGATATVESPPSC